MRYFYKAYGLIIDCDSELPFFTPVFHKDSRIDVTITLKGSKPVSSFERNWHRTHPVEKCESRGIEVWAAEGWIRVEYPLNKGGQLTFYLSENGRQLIADKPKSMLFSDMQAFVLGSTFGCLLRQHQKVCLHASVLAYNNKAFALIGHKGAGKSTTSAALLDAGAQLVSDDIAVLNFDQEKIMVEAGYPAIRLLPNSLQHYTDQLSNFKSVVSFSNKKYVPVPSPKLNWEFNSSCLPLEAIYILNTRSKTLDGSKLTTLPNTESLLAITPHSYTPYVLDDAQKKTEFKSLAKVTRSIGIKNISCSDNLNALPNIASNIIRDFVNTRD